MKTIENAPVQHEFPQELNANSADPMITETFGWAPAAVASWFVFFLIYAAMQPDFLKFTQDTSEFTVVAAIAVLPLLLFGYEFWRRRKSKTLVRLDQSNHIGIYRHGVFERIIFAQNIGIYTRKHANTFIWILFSFAGAIGSLIVLFGPSGPRVIVYSTADRFLAVATFFCSTALTVSVIRTRLFCKVLLLPRKGPRGFHSFLVQKEVAPGILRQF